MKRFLFLLIQFLVWVGGPPVQARELYRYYTSPNTVQIFQDFDAKIWVRINRIPELSWKKISIPPSRAPSQVIPKTVFVHGQLQKSEKSGTALVVNGTAIKLSKSGEFVLKVATEGPEFGLLITVRDLERHEDLKQTLGMRVYSVEPSKTEITKMRKAQGFVGTHVYNQYRLEQIDEPERLSASLAPPVAEIETKTPEAKKDQIEIYLGASFANYEQQTIFKQTPKNTFLRLNYEKNVGWLSGSPLWIGVDGRFSLFSISKNSDDTLQFLNPEVKLGLTLWDQPQFLLNLFTGTNYYSSFGNSNLGYKSFIGQAIQLNAKWVFAPSWSAQFFSKISWIPGDEKLFSSREILGGLAIRKDQWGLFSEYSSLQLTKTRDARLSAIRFGFFASF